MGDAGLAFHGLRVLILVVTEVLNRPAYIGRLFAFVAAAKEKHACPAQHRVVHPISRPQSMRNSDTPSRRRLQSPNFPRESRSIRAMIRALAWASCRPANHSPITSFPVPVTYRRISITRRSEERR